MTQSVINIACLQLQSTVNWHWSSSVVPNSAARGCTNSGGRCLTWSRHGLFWVAWPVSPSVVSCLPNKCNLPRNVDIRFNVLSTKVPHDPPNETSTTRQYHELWSMPILLPGNLKSRLFSDASSSSTIKDRNLSFYILNINRQYCVIPKGQLSTHRHLGSGPPGACRQKTPLALAYLIIADISAIYCWIFNLKIDLKSSWKELSYDMRTVVNSL